MAFFDEWQLHNSSLTKEMEIKVQEYSNMKPKDIIKNERHICTRTSPADLYYKKKKDNPGILEAKKKLHETCIQFEKELVSRGKIARTKTPPQCTARKKLPKSKLCNLKQDSSSEPSSGNESENHELLDKLEQKKAHFDRLHPKLWFNEPGMSNNGICCRCSLKAASSGICHNIFTGELKLLKCDTDTNNADKLFHYRIVIYPPSNVFMKTLSIIEHDKHEFVFEGFSMFSHEPLENMPVCKVVQNSIEFTILYIKEPLPQHFTIRELDLFHEFLFKEILELVDWDLKAAGDANSCSLFHFMPRFVRSLPENGKELLSMNYILNYLFQSSMPLIAKEQLLEINNYPDYKWQKLVDEIKGMVVTYPGKKPCSIRVDYLDKDQGKDIDGQITFPVIVHFGKISDEFSYEKLKYQKVWKRYVKFRQFLANISKPSYEDKRKLQAQKNQLRDMITQNKMNELVRSIVSSDGFYRTGIMCDIVQHAMLLPPFVAHLRFHRSLGLLESKINHKFKNRSLLQLALTHSSYRGNWGTNPHHAINSLTNCGFRQLSELKKGMNKLSFYSKNWKIECNERLEFLGDAVVQFVTSNHLFHLFPKLERGDLAKYRKGIVQNQYLAVLAQTLGLHKYMLYSHSKVFFPNLEPCRAMADCFEALVGAIFLDGGIESADEVFGKVLFEDDKILLKVWQNYSRHPLQEDEPSGDRQWIHNSNLLKKLTEFEDLIGVQFTHIRLLARAFTNHCVGFNSLTLGTNECLEYLGDSVLQLLSSEHVYNDFPKDHEGNLTHIRSSLVNGQTQAIICDDLGMGAYALLTNSTRELKMKDKSDLLGAFLGALYVDKGMDYCKTFCKVCFFPRLQEFLTDFNKNLELKQCSLALEMMGGR